MKSPAAIHNDEIDRGATFYREVVLYDDAAKTQPTSLAGKTVRATLMDPHGQHVADFACAVIATEPPRIAWSMPRATTAQLVPGKAYRHNLDLDDEDGVTTDRKLKGEIEVKTGQAPEAP